MNETLKILKERRSVRRYEARPVEREKLDAILEAGKYAPSAKGQQSVTMVVLTKREDIAELSALNAAVMGTDKDPYYGAPVIVLALADPTIGPWVEDASCALENMMLAAHALGLSTVWVHREREIFDSEAGKALLREWGLPETLRGVGSIALGYGAAPAPQPKPRKEGYILKV